jgi:hypothetical protein
LSKKYYGPFKVLRRIGTAAYELELPAESRIHPVIHVSQLRAYHGQNPLNHFSTIPQELENSVILDLPGNTEENTPQNNKVEGGRMVSTKTQRGRNEEKKITRTLEEIERQIAEGSEDNEADRQQNLPNNNSHNVLSTLKTTSQPTAVKTIPLDIPSSLDQVPPTHVLSQPLDESAKAEKSSLGTHATAPNTSFPHIQRKPFDPPTSQIQTPEPSIQLPHATLSHLPRTQSVTPNLEVKVSPAADSNDSTLNLRRHQRAIIKPNSLK